MSDSVRFADMALDPQRGLVETRVRVLKHSDIGRCPHVILVPDHYREDGTCRCNDPTATVMREWGYRWNKKKGQWVS